MKVALVQVALTFDNRSAGLQRLNAAIDQAAGHQPAPDLLILPGGCDTHGAASSDDWSDAVLRGVTETIAFKAREWGVFIAAGLHVCHESEVEPSAVLFDANGDVVARCPRQGAQRAVVESILPDRWQSSVGWIGLYEPSADLPPTSVVTAGENGMVLAVPTWGPTNGEAQTARQANVASLQGESDLPSGCFWAVVQSVGTADAPGDGEGLGSFLQAPDGAWLASVEFGKEAVVHAEVPISGSAGSM